MFGAREPESTIKFVDDYCQWYRKLFPEVRSFEAFKYLHVGMISDIKRKTLPAISRVVGLSNELLTITFPHRVALEIGATKTCQIKRHPTSIGRTRNYTNY
jgi:SRSO17 transposase